MRPVGSIFNTSYTARPSTFPAEEVRSTSSMLSVGVRFTTSSTRRHMSSDKDASDLDDDDTVGGEDDGGDGDRDGDRAAARVLDRMPQGRDPPPETASEMVCANSEKGDMVEVASASASAFAFAFALVLV